MPYDLVIRNARIATSESLAIGDLAVSNGKIAAVGKVEETGAEEFYANGLTLIPGLIDTQVHFREPGLEHKEDLESGTRAAIMGGVTSIFEMPNTNPTTTTPEALTDKLERAKDRAWCDHAFFVGATTENVDRLAELEMLPGSPGIKVFMGSSTGTLLVGDDEHLRRALHSGSRRVPIHAEDEPRNRDRRSLISANPHAREHPFLRDEESARLATERILALSAETGRPVHILHVSTLNELPLIVEAKQKGLRTTAEVTPQHLWFHAPACYDQLGTFAQMNPPIRSSEHQLALRNAVRAGVFDVFGSDHAPHTLEEKQLPYPQSPSGMPGVQTMLSALLTLSSQGLMDIRTLVRMACEQPAQIYGVKGKGHLRVGYDADLVLIDPNRAATFTRELIQSKCGWSPYEDETFVGWPIHIWLRGRQMVRDQELVGEQIGEPVNFDWK